MARHTPATTVRRAQAHSTAWLLAWAWLGAVVYASLFPFDGWRWPAGLAWRELLTLRWPRYFIGFDIVSNLLGYLPLGFLVTLSRLRFGAGVGAALLAGVAAGAAASYALEVLQHLLPPRVPSLLDWALNAGGAALGALLAAGLRWSGLLRHWQTLRERWLERGNGVAMALLLLWPVALLFPSPMPFGLGQVADPLREALALALDGVAWAEPARLWLSADADAVRAGQGPLAQHLAVVLGLIGPCLLAYATVPRGWRRAGLAAGALVVGGGATALSTALNFGPDHAMAWLTATTLVALVVALVLAAVLVGASHRLAAGLALMALTGMVVLVNQAATDPYLAQSLQGWEQGRFIRFHGAAQWVGRVWPFAAMAWLLQRLAAPARGVH